jgi:hypothetical protein
MKGRKVMKETRMARCCAQRLEITVARQGNCGKYENVLLSTKNLLLSW